MKEGALSWSAFPLAAKYDPKWVRDNALGENALCQVESLSRHLPLRAGMRVLDLGCGKATSSIFLAREFRVEAWAADAATSPTENHKRAIEMGCEASVFPLRVDAHGLPFAKEFFDAVDRDRLLPLLRNRRSLPELSRSVHQARRFHRFGGSRFHA